MIVGIGIDLVLVGRIGKWNETPGLCERYFHPRELEAARRKGEGGVRSLAARFAAKEAFGKAVGTGGGGFGLREIEVVNGAAGRPELRLYGKALEAFGRCGGKRVHLSLSHEKDNAVAVVVVEG